MLPHCICKVLWMHISNRTRPSHIDGDYIWEERKPDEAVGEARENKSERCVEEEQQREERKEVARAKE